MIRSKSYPGSNRWKLYRGEEPFPDDSGTSFPPILQSQDIFLFLCEYERKRAQRTGDSYTLILIDISGLEPTTDKKLSVERCLFHTTRNYDWKGWYRAGQTIGIIFTGLDESAEKTLKERLLNAFRASSIIIHPDRILASTYHISKDNKETVSPEEKPVWNPIVMCQDSDMSLGSKIQKRCIDVFGATLGILLFMPLFITIALLIKLSSKGPVFFIQERIGKNGKPFRLFKFRSMKVDCDDSIHRDFVRKLIRGENILDADGNEIYKIRKDPRITPLGHILRKTSLDELPQFFNVLKGDMSLVGPRPAIPYEVAQYNHWHCRRITAKPGITGFWQVEGRSFTSFDGMVRMDIHYIENWSVLMDLQLIFKTPLIIFSSRGAY